MTEDREFVTDFAWVKYIRIMGSTDKAVITGFICRLCSKMNRFVIHIYGEEGERMKLAEKINAYLPITVSHDLLNYFHILMYEFSNNYTVLLI